MNRPAALLFALGVLMTGLIGYLDAVTGPELAFSIFYLVPIGFVTWFSGKRRLGFLLSFLCAAAWVIDDRLIVHEYSSKFIPYWNAGIGLAFFHLFTTILFELRKALDRARILATFDPLTGALNPRAFYSVANDEIQRLGRYDHPFTFVFIDIDNFKTVNDLFGHNTGNLVLQALVSTIKKNIRVTDKIARLGGDEFGMLLTDTDFGESGNAVAKIRQQLLDHMKEKSMPVTFSMGSVTFLQAPSTADEMIRIADAEMYEVKRHGKNAVRFSIWPTGPAAPIRGAGSRDKGTRQPGTRDSRNSGLEI